MNTEINSDKEHLEKEELILRISKLEAQVNNLKTRLSSSENIEQLYKALSEQTLDAFFVFDGEGRFIEANEQACLKLGYTKEEILQLTVPDVEQDRTLEQLKARYKEMNPGDKFTAHGHHKRKDGSIFPVEVRFGCALWNSKKVFVGYVRDISGSQQAELNIRESESKFRTVFESANVGKSLTLISGEMFVNQAFADMLGYTRDELQMKTWKEITPEEDVHTIENLLQPLYTGKEDSIRIIKRYIRKDGSYIWTDVSGVLKRDEDGKGLYHIATIIDISDRIKAEEELEKLNKELEERVRERTLQLETTNKELQAFSYSVSHDLRAPLRSMKIYASILEDDYFNQLDEKGRKYIHSIRKNADRMDRLITDLLNLSMVSRSEIIPEFTDMREIAEHMFLELATDEERRSFEFVLKDIPAAYCDNSLIRQVWQNLLANAIKYSSKSDIKRIEITGKEDKYSVHYTIKDYGAGFDNRFGHKIFSPFQRLHANEEYAGNGIGLAIVNQIISRHGGKILAKGEPGKGASFTFSLRKYNKARQKERKILKYPGISSDQTESE